MDPGSPSYVNMHSFQRTSPVSRTPEVILPSRPGSFIPPYSALNAPVTSACTFDSVIDDVDKINTSIKRSTRLPVHCDSTCLNDALLHDNTTHQQRPRRIVAPDKRQTLFNGADHRYHDHDIDPHYATILVLEDFFDGIDDNVDVRMEVNQFDKALSTINFPAHREDVIDLGFATGSGGRAGCEPLVDNVLCARCVAEAPPAASTPTRYRSGILLRVVILCTA